MIQYHDGLCHIEKILALCITWFVGIHHDYYRIVIDQLLGLVAVHKHGRLIVRILHKATHQRPDGCSRIVDHDMHRLTKSLTCTVNTDSGSQSIHIGNLVSHNDHTVLGTHKLLQRLGFHTGFYTCGFLHLLRLAANVGDIIAVFDYYLIAATSQCHLNGNSGILIILNISGSIQTDSNT